MSKQKKEKSKEPLTPERVMRARIHRLADWSEITSFFIKLTWMIVFMVLLFGVFFGVTPMKNNDMSPRISSGDVLLYYRLEKNFHSQDVVVFEKDGKQYVGRIVAKGGDSVEVTDDSTLKINNSAVFESDIFYPTPKYGDEVAYPVVLEETQYFILCDYRNGAKDSRYFGAVNQSEIKGKVLAVLRRSSL